MNRAALRVVPELLHLVPALLPGGVMVAGTFDFGRAEPDGTVWLAIDGEGLTSGALYLVKVTDEGLKRTCSLEVAEASASASSTGAEGAAGG